MNSIMKLMSLALFASLFAGCGDTGASNPPEPTQKPAVTVSAEETTSVETEATDQGWTPEVKAEAPAQPQGHSHGPNGHSH